MSTNLKAVTNYIDLEQYCINVLCNNPHTVKNAFASTMNYINMNLDSLRWNTARAYVDRCLRKIYVFDGVSKTIDAPYVFCIQLCAQLELYKVPFSFTSTNEGLTYSFKLLFKCLANQTFDRQNLLTAYNYHGIGSDYLRKNLLRDVTRNAYNSLVTNQIITASTNLLCIPL